jgi:glycosidase
MCGRPVPFLACLDGVDGFRLDVVDFRFHDSELRCVLPPHGAFFGRLRSGDIPTRATR